MPVASVNDASEGSPTTSAVVDPEGEVGCWQPYGEEGIWGRWCAYADSGHGGNTDMKDIEAEDWHATVLEVFAPTVSAADVSAVENYWKDKLHTRTFGLNRN